MMNSIKETIREKSPELFALLKSVNATISRIKRVLTPQPKYPTFDELNPLGDGGERVDIQLQKKFSFDKLDMYQKNHYRRYEFALAMIQPGEVCGDFACGTGYGSVILSQKAKKVVGVDLNQRVIEEISKRYGDRTSVEFKACNLLDLDYSSYFDRIISFETVEHLAEPDIRRLFKVFNRALKPKGRILFSTPYKQPRSPEAIQQGFHLTFDIDEKKLHEWMTDAGFRIDQIQYQNYQTHEIREQLDLKEFNICFATKVN